MSRHDPKVTLRQMADYVRRAQELYRQNELAAILTTGKNGPSSSA